MDYDDTNDMLTILNGEKIVDINLLLSLRIKRHLFLLYSPLQLVIRRTKTYFPTLSFYSINYWWQNPFHYIYLHPVIEKLETSN